jgi:N-acetyl-beta-hexosaminidase
MNSPTEEAIPVNDQSIEQEIQAKGLTAPRITPADLKANIVGEYFFTAADGVQAAFNSQDELTRLTGAHGELALLTFCVLVLRNGFTVTGESACVTKANFDAEIGKKVARQNAITKIWPLMGYALKQQLHSAE